MKKYICLLFIIYFSLGLSGQVYDNGGTIDTGFFSDTFTYSDTKNSSNYGSRYTCSFVPGSSSAHDIIYKLTLDFAMDISVSHCGTSIPSSIYYILDHRGGKLLHYGGAYPGPDKCTTYPIGLQPGGVYYIVSEPTAQITGHLETITFIDGGEITTNITGTERKTGEDIYNPFMLGGIFSSNFNITPIVENIGAYEFDYYPENYERFDDYDLKDDYYYYRDVAHRFAITKPMQITLNNSNSGDGLKKPIYMGMISTSLDSIKKDDWNSIPWSYRDHTYVLDPGTYIVYSKAIISNSSKSLKYALNINAKEILPGLSGSSFSTPVDIGTKSADFSYTHTQNTGLFTVNRIDVKNGKEVFYKLILAEPMEIMASNCGSSVSDTYLAVYSSDQKLLYSNDDYSGIGACANTQNAYLKIPVLMPGTYYFVSDGVSDGNITTSIDGRTIGPIGDMMATAIDAGIYETGFSFIDTRNTSLGYSNRFNVKSTNDIFYKFKLTQPLNITVSHCGSAVTDTYMSVLNESGSVIYSNDDYTGGREHVTIPPIP